MGMSSSIEWCNATWNPVRGCSMARGSETGGCLNCYAARLMARGLPGLLSADGKPLARIMESGPRWTGKVELIDQALPLPLKWRKPKRIFVNSLSDLFHEALTDEQIDRVFAVMALCPQHTFQVLTKRPERMMAYMNQRYRGRWEASHYYPDGHNEPSSGISIFCDWPLPNVWLGVSVENQATADARVPLLLQTPAAKHFVSYEPALGPVDFDSEHAGGLHALGCGDSDHSHNRGCHGLDWIIVGGESGPGARPFDIQWARTIIEQCKAAGVACFVKQLGAQPAQPVSGVIPGHTIAYPTVPIKLKDRKGGDMSEWSEDLRVREFPDSDYVRKVRG